MPFCKAIKDELSGAWGGIWDVTESEDDLRRLLPSDSPYLSELDKFKLPKRRLEFLAARVLVETLMPDAPRIVYRPTGKPYFESVCRKLSISHTSHYVAVLFSNAAEVGIDIEAVSDRVMKVRNRIVSQREHADTLYEILLHWSAKETAFKILDVEGLDFCENFCVTGLHCNATIDEPLSEGSFILHFRHEACEDGEMSIYFQTTSDYVLTFSSYKEPALTKV